MKTAITQTHPGFWVVSEYAPGQDIGHIACAKRNYHWRIVRNGEPGPWSEQHRVSLRRAREALRRSFEKADGEVDA